MNESVTVTLFFPTGIQKVIQPAVNYKFAYEKNATMATLVARKGAASNLTVITECGSIFSFLLEYHSEVANFTYILSEEQAIGKMNGSSAVAISKKEPSTDTSGKTKAKKSRVRFNSDVKPKTIAFKQTPESRHSLPNNITSGTFSTNSNLSKKGASLYDIDTEDYYAIFCENNYLQKTKFNAKGAEVNRIGLQLTNVLLDREELYFVLEIDNNSLHDYNVSSLRFYVKSLEIDKEIEIEPSFVYNLKEVVPKQSANKLVFVCRNFNLAKGQRVYAQVKERGGNEQSVLLPLEARDIRVR